MVRILRHKRFECFMYDKCCRFFVYICFSPEDGQFVTESLSWSNERIQIVCV
jgi:hypothetical protein